MREGELHHSQHHPAALRVIIEKSSTKSYWILSDFDGKVGGSLHRYCTVVFVRVADLLMRSIREVRRSSSSFAPKFLARAKPLRAIFNAF